MTGELSAPLTLEQVTSRLDEVVLSSPADATEVVWLELRRSRIGHRLQREAAGSALDRCVVVRICEGRRVGTFRTGTADVGELRSAVRQAIVASRRAEAEQSSLLFPGASEPEPSPLRVADPAVQRLTADEAGSLLQKSCGRDVALLHWLDGCVAVANSRDLRRATEVTALDLSVRSGRAAEAGSAACSSRFLDQLRPDEVIARARARRGSKGEETVAAGRHRLLLSPEAVVTTLDCLHNIAFTAFAYRSGLSFLREHIGVQVFDRSFCLLDDATRSDGLPFPFDLEGRSKQPVELVAEGVPKTPALDLEAAARLTLAPTGHGLAGDDAQASNLFLQPGDLSEEELLGTARDGVWVGRIEHIECVDPLRVQIRAHLGGARCIRNGRLAGSLPGLLWEDSLLRAFSDLGGLGRHPVVRAERDALFGAISAPSVLVDEAPLRPVLLGRARTLR